MAKPVSDISDVRVSILIVNFRAYRELAGCLVSLSAFVDGRTETIVVDHASDDRQVHDLVCQFPWIRLLAVAANPGFSAGVNRAAREARGRYLLLLNPDSIVVDDVATSLAEWMNANANVGVCGALVRESDGSVQPSARFFPGVTTGIAGRTAWLSRIWPDNPWTARNLVHPLGAASPMIVDWVTGACMMIRRSAFDQAGGMDEAFFMYWEDADLCYRLKQLGWLTAYNPRVSVTHLTGRSSVETPARTIVAFHVSALRYFFKHGNLLQRLLSPLVLVVLGARALAKLLWGFIAGPRASTGRSSSSR